MKRLLIALLVVGALPASEARAVAHAWVTPGWAGYVARGESFSGVEGTWTQPQVTCNRPGSSVALWVGLGGASRSSRSLEQIGTSADCSDRGVLSYSAWFQLFPSSPVDVPVTVRPGDLLTAAVSVRGWNVTLELRNDSTGVAFSTQSWMRYPETDSAEWIVEAPSACLITCIAIPLAQFGGTRFLDGFAAAAAHTGVIGAWSTTRLEIGTANKRQTVTGPLSGDGSSFTVARHRGCCPRLER